MKSNIAEQLAPHYIAAFLNKCGCKSYGDVIAAMQNLIDVAQETKQGYQDHPEALKAETVSAIN
ncbi:hypothetical protein [Pseudoalteromonas piscicida]|uniref:hypothetical protein n=1 Tax=Pseudoalteromonas piscicida TaxID=43662 RepID=UPI0027E3B8C4|nr:hypothetical protein [Pseudoalteromonas piscicida]WMO14342.1 hypothetical protein NI376_01475 [Pseudoalteromonas piscicida]